MELTNRNIQNKVFAAHERTYHGNKIRSNNMIYIYIHIYIYIIYIKKRANSDGMYAAASAFDFRQI